MEESAGKVWEDKDEEIRRLRLQVTQLTNVIKKLTGQDQSDGEGAGRKKKARRAFDFAQYKRRHVLFRVAYFGWDYHGFAVQETSGKTVESELFRALSLTRLIEDRQSSNYHRCGRTDKGVSAFHQVVSIDVRSNLLEGPGVFDFDGCTADQRPGVNIAKEIDFCKVLNSNLPQDIQVVAWAPCENRTFSARFDCVSRTYKYFFPLADLNLSAINEAGTRLCGDAKDFRNFCKLDVHNGVTNYVRRIDHVQTEVIGDGRKDSDDPYSMCVLTVTGRAFLWHQIRCIASVLFLVGRGLEDPSVVDQLLDVDSNPRRPQYGMASEVPLNLFSCDYATGEVDWCYDEEAIRQVVARFQALWTEHQVKATMLRTALDSLQADPKIMNLVDQVRDQLTPLLPKMKAKTYTPLLQMLKCPSLDEKISTSKRLKTSRKLAEARKSDNLRNTDV